MCQHCEAKKLYVEEFIAKIVGMIKTYHAEKGELPSPSAVQQLIFEDVANIADVVYGQVILSVLNSGLVPAQDMGTQDDVQAGPMMMAANGPKKYN